jgi:dihydroorotate dehydrogenase
MAGASGVQIGSAIYHDVGVIAKIWEDVRKFLENRGTSFEKIVGMSHTENGKLGIR